jgi:hypothetical protein
MMIGNGTPISHNNAPFPRPMTLSFAVTGTTLEGGESSTKVPCHTKIALLVKAVQAAALGRVRKRSQSRISRPRGLGVN